MGTGIRRWALALWLGLWMPGILLQVLTRNHRQTPVEQPQYALGVLVDAQVQQLGLEEYVLGVVLAEMPVEFEPEALKAQAVVARTYCLRRESLADKHDRAAVCTSPDCCQGWCSSQQFLDRGGTEQQLQKVEAAVGATAGQVLTYEGQLIEATYFACSGGYTEDAAAVWGAHIPYLQATESPGEEQAGSYSSVLEFTRQEFAGRLQLPEDFQLGETEYTRGGGVQTIRLSDRQFTGLQLRQLLQLPSTAFSVAVQADRVAVTCRGHGHRVGMSQYGADAMALSGSDYRQILAHYYRDTQLTDWSGFD